MQNQYRVVEVEMKFTGEKRIIKLDRFNPELHKKLSQDYSQDYALLPNQPVSVQSDLIGKAVLQGQLKAKEEKEKESTPVVESSVEVEEKTTDNDFDVSVELSIEEVEKLLMWQLRKYAKHRGIEVQPKSTKKELVAQVSKI